MNLFNLKKIVVLFFAAALLLSGIYPVNAQTANRYTEYKGTFAGKDTADTTILIDDIENWQLEGDVHYSQEEKSISLGENGGKANLSFNVPKSGNYNLRITYKPFQGKITLLKSSIGIYIDGESPFFEAESLYLSRPWKNSEDTITDSRGNEIAPAQEECYEWFTECLTDPNGNENLPLEFYLSEGAHTLDVEAIISNIYIKQIEFIPVKKLIDYSEYKLAHKEDSYNKTDKNNRYVQAEDFYQKSDSTIIATSDKSDSKNIPVDASSFLLNIISGDTFQKTGQWVEWQIDVPESGFYNISMRVKQDAKSGKFCSRRLYIDGEVPFQECMEIQIPYDSKWQLITLGNADGNYDFYLEKGIRTIRLESVSGIYGDVYIDVQEIITKLNGIYNQVIMICGTQPDPYRDYKLDVEIPDLKNDLLSVKKAINNTKDMIIGISGGSGSEISTLNSLIQTLNVYAKDLDKIPNDLDAFRSDIESLATWNSSLTAQPVSIDYFYFSQTENEFPKANASFFENLWFNFKKWLASYTDNYGVIGDIDDSSEQLTVWMGAGRDQLKVCKDLIDGQFTKDYGISVNLQITPTSIISAIMAGTGPDVSLFENSEIPVALASKNALLKMSDLEGFESVEARFMKGTTAPMYYNGGCYGIPLTESFPMMFVRTDIFSELGLEIPSTWDDLYYTVAVLQRKNLDFALPTHIGTFITMLYQSGGSFYNKDITQVELNSQAAKDSFIKWTDFFCKYSFPVSYDFYNRFRSGQMPIGIADYTLYSTLKAAAPEIQGQWVMVSVPGIADKNGKIDNTVSICSATGSGSGYGLLQSLTCAIILKDSKLQEDAWKFVKWFSSAEIQASYGNRLECVLGESGRYTPANVEAFKLLPWTNTEKENLLNAWQNVKVIEEIPGNYYTARYLTTAFRNVVYDDTIPMDTLNKYQKIINKELRRKDQ